MPVQKGRVAGRYWRVMAPRWAHAPLSGKGAARNGGRFNAPGREALYLSRDLMTAIAEYEQDLGVRPGTFSAYDVDITDVVDLTRPETLRDLGIEQETLACAWRRIVLAERDRPPTWDLAERLIAEGARGVQVPSYAFPAGVNLVLWQWNTDDADRVTALDPQTDLPRDGRSWTA